MGMSEVAVEERFEREEPVHLLRDHSPIRRITAISGLAMAF
jgi:hypothetical protein